MCKKDIQTQLDDMNGEEDVNELDISIEDERASVQLVSG